MNDGKVLIEKREDLGSSLIMTKFVALRSPLTHTPIRKGKFCLHREPNLRAPKKTESSHRISEIKRLSCLASEGRSRAPSYYARARSLYTPLLPLTSLLLSPGNMFFSIKQRKKHPVSLHAIFKTPTFALSYPKSAENAEKTFHSITR